MPTAFLDCGGVLADFAAGGERAFGMPPKAFERRFGPKRCLDGLAAQDDVFGALALLPDALALYEAVRHRKPIILTGLPRGSWAEPQRRRWAARHCPDAGVIATRAALKREHCRPGDVLVDDRGTCRSLRDQAGGRVIHHRDAVSSIQQLRAHGVL